MGFSVEFTGLLLFTQGFNNWSWLNSNLDVMAFEEVNYLQLQFWTWL